MEKSAGTSSISLYTHAKQNKSDRTIQIDIFLDGVREGTWQDIVIPIRAIGDPNARRAAKEKAPCVTIAGVFNVRNDSGCTSPSGFISVDIDAIDDPSLIKDILINDKYIYSCFTSISGRGLCLLYRVDSKKHREAFQGISEFLLNNYNLIADPTSINISRLRYISYDPDIYINANADKFTIYPIVKEPKKIDKIVFVKDDFTAIIDQIQTNRINLCENYYEWVRIGFALVHQFNEIGRDYFHIISAQSGKYTPTISDRQYTACLKAQGGTIATISTLYFYAKQAGIRLYSERTKKIVHSAIHGKRGGLSKEQVDTNLQKFEDITGSVDIIKQVYEGATINDDDTLIDQVELWTRQNYLLKRNIITGYIENNGRPMNGKEFNSIFIRGKKIFDKLTFELIDRLINSDFIQDYNPFLDWFDINKDRNPAGVIRSFWSTINTDTGLEKFFPDYPVYFGTKWLVGLISSIHGQHCPLVPVLSGAIQNTGKTEFFRRMLPIELRSYYAESKLDAGKDDEILMTQKWIVMDDEMSGKSKKDEKRLKELTSKQTFSLREPYGRHNIDLIRIAALAATTNDEEILNDPTGNRRFIPIKVLSINQDDYNNINKSDLIMEAYNLYKSGFNWQLTKNDIDILNDNTSDFKAVEAEFELIDKFFELPASQCEGGVNQFLTTTEIKSILEMATHQKLQTNKIGQTMRKIGWEPSNKRVNGMPVKGYWVVRRSMNLF